MKYLAGIDEAARGAILGNMVLTAAYIDKEYIQLLNDKESIKDSKLLNKKQRDRSSKYLEEDVESFGHVTLSISPLEIDKCRKGYSSHIGIRNLNDLEAYYFASLIGQVITKLDNAKIEFLIDCPIVDTKKYEVKIKQFLTIDISESKSTIICENKADEKYKIVSAASIIAKHTRDLEVKELNTKYGNLGSGYPGDRRTMRFLKELKGPIPVIRKTWRTWKNIELAN